MKINFKWLRLPKYFPGATFEYPEQWTRLFCWRPRFVDGYLVWLRFIEHSYYWGYDDPIERRRLA